MRECVRNSHTVCTNVQHKEIISHCVVVQWNTGPYFIGCQSVAVGGAPSHFRLTDLTPVLYTVHWSEYNCISFSCRLSPRCPSMGHCYCHICCSGYNWHHSTGTTEAHLVSIGEFFIIHCNALYNMNGKWNMLWSNGQLIPNQLHTYIHISMSARLGIESH